VAEQMWRRVPTHAIIIFGVWPLVTLLVAAYEFCQLPYSYLWPSQALAGAAAGVVFLAPDFLVVGLLALLVSTLSFGTLAAYGILPASSPRAVAAEPVLLFLAAYFGIALCYPTVVSHPVLAFAHDIPVLPVTLGLGAFALLTSLARTPGWRGGVVAAVTLTIGVALPQPVFRGWMHASSGSGRAPLVVLGLDSLSHDDDLTALRAISDRHDGTWYTHAVTPALFTNVVWTSILLARPPHEHGVFQIFQPFPPATATLVSRARSAGFRTVSLFPDQITCAVGSQAGFDDDRSGPVGWRQLATQFVENGSLLLPVVRPILPMHLLSTVPDNHAGSFAYDLDRELDGIFGEGDRGGRALVVSHLTYLHHPRFPSYRELTSDERSRVWSVPAGEARDWSFDWQDSHETSGGLALRPWKVHRLTTAVAAAIERTGFLRAERGGQLLLLSDHGDRVGLTPNTFWKAGYHHVPLLTVGLPARSDPDAPISLLDVVNLVGLAPDEPAHDPAVELAMPGRLDWVDLTRTVKLGWDGSVSFDPALMARVFHALRMHRPWPEQRPAQVYLVFASPQPAS